MSKDLISEFSPRLTRWYNRHKRDLPWRHTTDPYLIWLSEIILQQTRVAQGLEYYLRFVARFPSLSSLAEASEDEVLRCWQGLGYYSRARNLHAAAKSMNGVFPSSYDGVLALKGVGVYTAAAICSFAYRMPYAVVDGNVYRVLSRIFRITDVPDSSAGKKCFASLAQDLLDKKRPDIYNQAIMDFGATQCVPSSPDCGGCPFQQNCWAYMHGQVARFPVKAKKINVSSRYFNYIYVKQGESLWLHKRTADDIWKNLFELPLVETERSVLPEELAATKAFTDLFAKGAVASVVGVPVKHVLSHRVIHATFYKLDVPLSFGLPDDFVRVPVQDVDKYAVSRLVHLFLEKYILN